MLRYCAECDVNIGGNIACGSFFFPDELKDLLAAWFGDYGEGIVHGYILVYTKMMRKSSRRTAWPTKVDPAAKHLTQASNHLQSQQTAISLSVPMDIRDRILDAAKKIYAQHGFRGATTRLIAIEAGVNEVTLFRTFGSKAALFESLMDSHVAGAPIPELPDNPVDPEREMTEWVTGVLDHMRENRALIRTSFGEIEDRPEAAVSMCEGPHCAGMILTDYLLRLQSTGIAAADGDIPTAVAMLMSSMFGDAISRDVMPTAFPQPQEEAPAKYVRIFLRALGVNPARLRVSVTRSAAGD